MTDTWVYTDKKLGWVNVDDTEFVGIEETYQGDEMCFIYNDKEYTSIIVMGSRPG